MRQKETHSMYISFTATKMPQAQVPKVRKSHNQYIACLPFALFTAAQTNSLLYGRVASFRTYATSLAENCRQSQKISHNWSYHLQTVTGVDVFERVQKPDTAIEDRRQTNKVF